jgi:hypothetical protein
VVVAFHAFLPAGGNNEGGLGAMAHDSRKAAGMIRLRVVGHNHIDLRRIDNLSDIFYKFILKGFPGGVHEDNLFINNKIGIIGGSPMGGKLMPMELPQSPIHDPNPIHPRCHFRNHFISSCDELLFSKNMCRHAKGSI